MAEQQEIIQTLGSIMGAEFTATELQQYLAAANLGDPAMMQLRLFCSPTQWRRKPMSLRDKMKCPLTARSVSLALASISGASHGLSMYADKHTKMRKFRVG